MSIGASSGMEGVIFLLLLFVFPLFIGLCGLSVFDWRKKFFERFLSRIIELYFCIENLPSEEVMKFSAGGSIFNAVFDMLLQEDMHSRTYINH